MMKKILSIALVLLLCLSMLAACGEEAPADNNTDNGGSTTTTTTGSTTVSAAEIKAYLEATYQKGSSSEAMIIKEDMTVIDVYKGVDIVWSVEVTEGDAAAVKITAGEGNAIIDVADSVEAAVVFTATATVTDADGNTAAASFLFTIPGPVADPAANSTLTLAEATALGVSKKHDVYTSNKYYVVGTISVIDDEFYGNMKIKDDAGNMLTIRGSFGPDGKDRIKQLDPMPKVGDTVKIYGIIGQYNDVAQMKNGWITEINGKKPGKAATTTRPSVTMPSANSTITVEQAIAIAQSKEHDTYTDEKFYISATVTEVYNEEYGNMRVKDDKGNILTIYGTFSADGAYTYSELKTKVKAGDVVKLYGRLGQYNDAPQMKNAWIIEVNGKKPEVDPAAGEKLKATVVTSPKVGVAYKFGLDQTMKGSVYFFTGKMSGYYGATDNKDASLAVDVFLEEAEGGYKIYFKDASGKKQYIKLEQSGTHYNFTFGATGSVFTYDTERNAFYAPCGDQICYMGTYGNYVTVGCLTSEKLKDSDYIARFYILE